MLFQDYFEDKNFKEPIGKSFMKYAKRCIKEKAKSLIKNLPEQSIYADGPKNKKDNEENLASIV